MTDTNIDALPPVDLDDEEDLSTLDRGDALPGDEADDEADGKGGKERDEKGRFKPKEDAKKDDEEEEEPEEEEDEESEEEEDEESEGDEKGKGKNELIRLNKMRAQRDAERAERAKLEARLAELEKSKAPAKDDAPDPIEVINTELDSLYEQVEEARADNDIKKAASLQRQIDAKNHDIVRIEAERIASKATTVSTENVRYDAMLEQYEASYPILDPKSDDFDPKAVQAMEYYVALHEKGGMSPTKALKQTVQLLFGAPPAKQESQPDPKKMDPDAKPPVKKPDVKKAADTQKRQPPDASDKGNNNDDPSIKVTQLSEEDFEKLPETKKAQLRGDFG